MLIRISDETVIISLLNVFINDVFRLRINYFRLKDRGLIIQGSLATNIIAYFREEYRDVIAFCYSLKIIIPGCLVYSIAILFVRIKTKEINNLV